mmetsp:Transcript_5574/g.13580  ORF Transcript_5574/g.13580 Transcript_5574/m.13580 type:complete len:290 (+) Transcript_5574:100-969(+)
MGATRRSIAAGALAGACEATATCPLDTIKVRMQEAARRSQKHHGIIATGVSIVRNEGVLALWKGWTPLVLGVMVKKALRFSSFSSFKSMFADKAGKLSAGMTFLGGVYAGFIETFAIVTPSEMVKIRMQTNRMESRSLLQVVPQILWEEGLLAFYKGSLPTLIRQTTNQGCRFLTYSRIMDELKRRDHQQKNSYWHSFVAGGMAGGLNVYLNTPADVVKTRMQNQVTTRNTRPEYKNTLDCLQKVARTEGMLALWRGSTARVVRLVPGQAITFGAFNFFDNLLKDTIHL